MTENTRTAKAVIEPSGVRVGRFVLHGREGSFDGAFTSKGLSVTIGSHTSSDLVLDDATVSRFHCEITIEENGLRIRDLGSRNGTIVDNVLVNDAWLREGSRLRLGNTVLELLIADSSTTVRISPSNELGGLVGQSAAMRTVFATLERIAASDATVLIHGESGTGKEEAARIIHEESHRASHPFVVIDVGALSPTLVESELFGHERGAFTGANDRRLGAFEQAHRGTVFLDEIGEMPLELQPRLLRVLETRSIKRLGGSEHVRVDVRIVAATHRDLRRRVNEGKFREDLYHRLAVLRVDMPPLRERPEDVTLIAERVLRALGASDADIPRVMTAENVIRWQAAAWPGNVRQLRNTLARTLVMGDELTEDGAPETATDPFNYAEARRRAIGIFEVEFVKGLVASHDGDVARAAETAGVTRGYIYRILRRQKTR